jgi:hypothetical protein
MQRIKAYVGFVDGLLQMEKVHDANGDFVGFTVYADWAGAETRYNDVREVELRIGARCVKAERATGS